MKYPQKTDKSHGLGKSVTDSGFNKATGLRRLIKTTVLATAIALVPAQSHAGPHEDALEDCLSIAPFLGLGGLVFASGCLAGYAVTTASSEGTHPKFSFGDTAFDTGPLGGNILLYSAGERHILSSGLWKGCPPNCMKPVELSPGKEDVDSVEYAIAPLEQAKTSSGFDGAEWKKLGDARYNGKTHAWELQWETADDPAGSGYILRADFHRADGTRQTAFGVATQRWIAQQY